MPAIAYARHHFLLEVIYRVDHQLGEDVRRLFPLAADAAAPRRVYDRRGRLQDRRMAERF